MLEDWIASDRDWPGNGGPTPVRLGPEPEEPWTGRPPEPEVAAVCRRSGLRAGDLVRLWPYDGEPVARPRHRGRRPRGARLGAAGRPRGGARRPRAARAFACPVCGDCAGPAAESPSIRPCPACLVDLRRLEQSADEAPRIRRAIEARATAGLATATSLGDERLVDRARERRRWSRRLLEAGPEDLHAALLAAFGRAYERWGARVVA